MNNVFRKKNFVSKSYKLGDPTDSSTNLGPVVSVASAERIKKQVVDAGNNTIELTLFKFALLILKLVAAGAKALIPEDLFPAAVA